MLLAYRCTYIPVGREIREAVAVTYGVNGLKVATRGVVYTVVPTLSVYYTTLHGSMCPPARSLRKQDTATVPICHLLCFYKLFIVLLNGHST